MVVSFQRATSLTKNVWGLIRPEPPLSGGALSFLIPYNKDSQTKGDIGRVPTVSTVRKVSVKSLARVCDPLSRWVSSSEYFGAYTRY